jgi:curli biogenesis system outer membrane secretion channel CsgG
MQVTVFLDDFRDDSLMKTSLNLSYLAIVLTTTALAQQKGVQKPVVPPPISGPKRTIVVDSVDVKCANVTNGVGTGGSSSVTIFGGNNSVNGAATVPVSVPINDPNGFGSGLAEMMITALDQSKAFVVLDKPKQAALDPVAAAAAGAGGVTLPPVPDAKPGPAPQLLIRASVTDLVVSTRSGGFNLANLGGKREEFTNKVIMDVRLVDPATNLVLETVRCSGQKSSKSDLLGIFTNDDKKLFGYDAFASSPLGEATRLALEDGVKKLIAKLNKYPWQATVVEVVEEADGSIGYLNVGEGCGLKGGDTLEVGRAGKDLVDPATGRLLGKSRATVLGRVTVISVEGTSVRVKSVGEFKTEAGMVVWLVKG